MKGSQKLAEFLLENVRVVTVPGREFGFGGHLRLSYCGAAKEITEGLDRIKWDPAVGGCGAADLRVHAAIRNSAGKRGVRPGFAALGFERRPAH